jgi:hypothetical protein
LSFSSPASAANSPPAPVRFEWILQSAPVCMLIVINVHIYAKLITIHSQDSGKELMSRANPSPDRKTLADQGYVTRAVALFLPFTCLAHYHDSSARPLLLPSPRFDAGATRPVHNNTPWTGTSKSKSNTQRIPIVICETHEIGSNQTTRATQPKQGPGRNGCSTCRYMSRQSLRRDLSRLGLLLLWHTFLPFHVEKMTLTSMLECCCCRWSSSGGINQSLVLTASGPRWIRFKRGPENPVKSMMVPIVIIMRLGPMLLCSSWPLNLHDAGDSSSGSLSLSLTQCCSRPLD